MITNSGLKISMTMKLVAATLVVLTTALAPLIYQNYNVFRKVTEKREMDANVLSANAKAIEIDNISQNLFEKVKAIAILSMGGESQEVNKSVDILLEQDSDLFAIDVYQRTNGEFRLTNTFFKKETMSLLGTAENYIETARKMSEFSIESIARGQLEIKKLMVSKEVPLMAIGFSVVKDDLGYSKTIGIAYVYLSKLQRIIRQNENQETFLVDRNGTIFSNANEKILAGESDLRRHPLFELARKSNDLKGQLHFSDPLSGDSYHGAFAKTNMGLLVFNQVNEKTILAPIESFLRSDIIIVGFGICGSLVFIYLFGLSFVSPIEKISDLVGRVGSGDFTVAAAARIKRSDELGSLALAFDEMVENLKLRDKEKQLLATVPNTMLMEENFAFEPVFFQSKKKFTVFVSSIRGLNDLNSHLPDEDIVNTLNEYFAILVKVVKRHGGAVDKFINNNFVVIWGFKEEDADDARNAVEAALDLRRAIAELNEKRLVREQKAILIGMGLHQGLVIQSAVGHEQKFEYTLPGGTMTMASNIEALTEERGTDLLISGDIAKSIQESIWVEYSIDVAGAGRGDQLQLFEVKGVYKDGKRLAVPVSYSYEEAEEKKRSAA